MSADMTSAETPSQPKDGEVSLEDIDKLLEAEDPGFTKQLEEVRSVEVDKSINIESDVPREDALSGESQTEPKPETRAQIIRAWIRARNAAFRQYLRVRLVTARKDLIIFLKTRPKEFLFFAISILKISLKKAMVPLRAFQSANRLQKITVFVLVAMMGGMVWVLKSNIKGIWIPQLNEPLLTSFEEHADWTETYDPKDGGESFYSAFPQERHEFLFGRMKVNLQRTAENPNPMGAFEVIVQVDSKDTAIELRDREVEFFDYLQRVMEEETFTDLESEGGKAKLKGRLKRELNQKLTQGWVKEISFKTFVLKP